MAAAETEISLRDPVRPLLRRPLPPRDKISALASGEEAAALHCRFLGMPQRNTAATVKPAPVAHQPDPFSAAAVGPVVVTVSVVVPLPVTEYGLKPHLLSRGRPAQDAHVKLIVLLYPVCPVIVSVSVPEPPGLVLIEGALPEKAKSGCTVTVIAAEVETL